MNVNGVITNGVITLNVDGQTFSVDKNHPNRAEIVEKMLHEDWGAVVALIRPLTYFEGARVGDFRVANGDLVFEGNPVDHAIAERIKDYAARGWDFMPLAKCLRRFLDNPNPRSRAQGFDFLRHNRMPIAEDGCFYAYKMVRANYLSDGRGPTPVTVRWPDGREQVVVNEGVPNNVGNKVSMNRAQVNPNPDEICSAGLHFCSYGYQFVDGRHLIIKIDPKDIVSIPSDYNGEKGRCCAYEVVGETTSELKSQNDIVENFVPGRMDDYKFEVRSGAQVFRDKQTGQWANPDVPAAPDTEPDEGRERPLVDLGGPGSSQTNYDDDDDEESEFFDCDDCDDYDVNDYDDDDYDDDEEGDNPDNIGGYVVT